MFDFLKISTRSGPRGILEVYPKFIIKKSKDLMIRGGDFYAIWNESDKLWSTDEQDAIRMIDIEIDEYVKNVFFNGKEPDQKDIFDRRLKVLHMWDAESGMIDVWHKYCQKQLRDSFHMLDETIVFSNTETKKENYASKKLSYPLEEGDISAYDKLISTLYEPSERHKIEWAIGSIVQGDSKNIQKFVVMYGSAGTGKSTILNIIQMLFSGYYNVFDAKALGSSSNSFALEAFKTNPLVGIQHDGDLSRIEDNTRLNSLVSHELMTVNEKFKSAYSNRFKCFLFMGTNKPVKITDAKSGLMRRLIDVSPSGKKVSSKEYVNLMNKIKFELGAIAYHCRSVYLDNPSAYDDYIPVRMMSASNDFYNFMLDSYFLFKNKNYTTLKSAWEMYKSYCEDANISYPFTQRIFKEELKNYFTGYHDRFVLDDGTRVRSYYYGFKDDKFDAGIKKEKQITAKETLNLSKHETSILDEELSECPAQYASKKETPYKAWDNVNTTLQDIDSTKLHYVKPPENLIVIDFDITDADGNKSFELNEAAASKWPATYTETSKSGNGIHLHYYYDGDVTKLSAIYDEHVEIKVFSGKSSLRRKLTLCNDLPIATINSGLPMKGDSPMINFDGIKNEKALRTLIKRNLNKEYHSATKPSIDFINKVLNDAYISGMHYDVTDLRQSVLNFAMNSTNQSALCIKMVNDMHFCSDDPSDPVDFEKEAPIVFYDVEVFPNLFLVNWKIRGKENKVNRLINPTPLDIEELIKYRLIGFNNRKYDNHMLYACLIGYTNLQIYELSKHIIAHDSENCFFKEAYNLSYTDIYDFSSKKQSLKKFEIELGIHHKELNIPWDEPVPKERWVEVAEYCDNDVLATEAVFDARQADWTARQILADISGGSVNDKTSTLSAKIIFGNDRTPQSQFNYRDMGDCSDVVDKEVLGDSNYTKFDSKNRPVFPGYKYSFGVSEYRGVKPVKEGGRVYAEPGMYGYVALLDVESMHPSSIENEDLFGTKYTKRFSDLKRIRILIKHEKFNEAKTLFDGKLIRYLDDKDMAKQLSNALKIVINQVYGLTSAHFTNPFKDDRNIDNIVAKRGALFMINLEHEVKERGFKVAHIKTDSIKIPDATLDIINFVMEYGKQYGYKFEHEATYERMCLVNDAVYIAKFATKEDCIKLYGYSPDENIEEGGKWTATGAQFQIPYVFKTIFSKEDLVFEDLCMTKAANSSMYLDYNEQLPSSELDEKDLDKLSRTLKQGKISKDEYDILSKELKDKIAKKHCYKFVGRVGNFCPISQNNGGGILVREQKNPSTGETSLNSVTGTKGFRWLESEVVKESNLESKVDMRYFNNLANDAKDAISNYCDYEWFVSDDPYILPEYHNGIPIYN